MSDHKRTPKLPSTRDPEEILRLAELEPVHPKEVKRREALKMGRYVKAAEVLRRKGYSWYMIAQWLEERSVYFTENTIRSAVEKWGQTDEYVEWCVEQENKEQELDVGHPKTDS